MKLNRTGSIWDRNERININDNWDIIEDLVLTKGESLFNSESFNAWLEQNKFKNKDAVDKITDLPTNAEVNEIRGVLSESAVYIYNGDEWIKQNDLNYNELNVFKNEFRQDNSVSVYVPQDYPDIQTAIDILSRKVYKANVTVNIILQSGYIIKKGVSVKNGDYSHFIVTSVDPVVLADITTHLFYGLSANMPELSCLIDMQGNGRTGYYAENSRGKVSANCGVINAGESGISANSASQVMAQSSIFTGASAKAPQHTGITARRGSTVNADYADVSGSNYYGISAASGALVSAVGAKADNCLIYGFRARDGAMMSCAESTAKNCGDTGYYALWSGIMDARATDASGSKTGYYSAEGGNINARGAIARDCVSYGVYASHGSVINANACNIANAGNQGVRSESSSNVNVRGGSITGSVNTDLAVLVGSFITASEATFNTANVTNFNSIIESRGVIWNNAR